MGFFAQADLAKDGPSVQCRVPSDSCGVMCTTQKPGNCEGMQEVTILYAVCCFLNLTVVLVSGVFWCTQAMQQVTMLYAEGGVGELWFVVLSSHAAGSNAACRMWFCKPLTFSESKCSVRELGS